MEALLQGWLDGDGCVFKDDNETNGTTVSRDLAMAMYDIVQAIGRRAVIRYSIPKVSHGVKRRLPRWDINFRADPKDNYRSIEDEKHVWRRVNGLETVPFNGPVFNLTVEGDNSYVAEGIGVHNCVGQASRTAFSYAWDISGQPHHDFHPRFVYTLINGGRDEGAIISDALVALKTYGIALNSDGPTEALFRRHFSKQAFETAKRFKVLEGYKLRSFEEICSAISNGLAVVSGIMVGRNFGNLDSEGTCPVPDYPLGGHALCHIGLKRSHTGAWLLETQNSWGTRWGNGGFCYLRKEHYSPQWGMPMDAYAIQADADDPQDDSNDPPDMI